MTTTSPTVAQTIAQVATRLGIPVPVALADAEQESGLNASAVGDQGTSFGLFQLHEGGELGSHTQAWADDPTNNATTALTEFAAVHNANPSLDWGQVAAAAQRPQNQAAYAASVNSILARYGGATATPAAAEAVAGPGSLGAGNGGSGTDPAVAAGLAGVTGASGGIQNVGIIGDVTGAVSSGVGAVTGLLGDGISGAFGAVLGGIEGAFGVKSLKDLAERAGLIMLGGLLLIVGLVVLVKDTSAGQAAGSAVKDAGVAAVAA